MDVLPWLLDWPPSRSAVAVFLVVTAASVGTLVLFGGATDEVVGGEVTVESAEFAVRLNDETTIPETGNGTVRTCVASGTPGDRISVTGPVTLDVPAEWGGREQPLELVVSLAHTDANTVSTIERTGTVRIDLFWLLEDDETLSTGDSATVQVQVRAGDATLASITRSVRVEDGTRSYDC